jgi:hypothetical protein
MPAWLDDDEDGVISDLLPKLVDAAWEDVNITVVCLFSMAAVCGR